MTASNLPPSPVPTAPNFAICVLYYGNLLTAHQRCMTDLAYNHGYKGRVFAMHGCPYIDMGRSAMAAKALSDGFDGVLFIDHDITFQVSDVARVTQDAHDKSAIIGGAYGMRSANRGTMIGGFAKSVRRARFFEGGGLYPAEYLGMGFTAIPRVALEQIRRHHALEDVECLFSRVPVTPWFQLGMFGGHWCGEDVSFCRRATQAGVELLLDTRIRLGHLGQYTYGIEDGWAAVGRFPEFDIELTEPETVPDGLAPPTTLQV